MKIIQMKCMLKFFFYVVTLALPSITHCRELKEYLNDVNEIAKARGSINGIFRPFVGGYLGIGNFAFAHQGKLHPIEKVVAMKFTKPELGYSAEKEYRMYSYLGAINDTNIERYGIPVVYYYGKCMQTGLILMAVSLLDQSIGDFVNTKELLKHDVNILIMLRDFILSSKYMHLRGVRHDDVKFENLMVRTHKTFLIDFNISSKMNEKSIYGTFEYLSRAGHSTGMRYPKDDWETWLYSVCTAIGIELPWRKWSSKFFKLISNTTNTLALIEKVESETLRNVLREFAQHVFDDDEKYDDQAFRETWTFHELKDISFHLCNKKRFPDYNYWYKLVDDKIKESNLAEPVLFTWLTPEQRNAAIADLKEHPMPDIKEIDEPNNSDYSAKKYPIVEYEKFTQAYKDWKAPVQSSEIFVSVESSHDSKKGSAAKEYLP